MIIEVALLSLLLAMVLVSAMLYAKTRLWILHNDLETWISYGTGSDIVTCREQRKEYQYFVRLVESNHLNRGKDVAKLVIVEMRTILRSRTIFKASYFHILWHELVLLTHWVRSKVMGK